MHHPSCTITFAQAGTEAPVIPLTSADLEERFGGTADPCTDGGFWLGGETKGLQKADRHGGGAKRAEEEGSGDEEFELLGGFAAGECTL
jgi:hypothetical protein